MSQRPFQFLHAADLHLDEPIEGLANAPAHLADLLIDCPLEAARRVFDAALQHHVDFVVLAGDVVDLRRGSPRELAFLVEQFQRLEKHNIVVYWAGGEIDSTDWPARFTLPGNVKLASRFHLQRLRHEIDGTPVCELVGRSRSGTEVSKAYDFAGAKSELFSIAVAHGEFTSGLGEFGISYWALGGCHARSTQQPSPTSIAHHPGTPQSRRPSESGPHGCTLVQVDQQGQVRLTPITTDVVRWQSPRLALGQAADRAELERVLREQMQQYLGEPGGPATLIQWRIACEGPLLAELRRGALPAQLLDLLQREFGHRSPALWSVAIEPELPDHMPAAWQGEETLRGDFLRAIQNLLTSNPSDPQLGLSELNRLLAGGQASAEGAWVDRRWTALDDPTARRRILREAAWLGADLLSPEEAAR